MACEPCHTPCSAAGPPGCSLKSKVEFSLPMLLSGIAGATQSW